MRNFIAAMAAMVVASAGVAHATAYVLDVTSTPYVWPTPHPGASGFITFPAIDLYPGDSLTLNVTFSPPLPNNSQWGKWGQVNYTNFNLKQHYGLDDGEIHLDYPYTLPIDSAALDGFSITATASSEIPNPGPQYSFLLSSLEYAYAEVPEPSLWVLMVIGVGLLGGTLRFSKAPLLRCR